jgi:hypothetical protein
VKAKPPEEFVGAERHQPHLTAMSVVLPSKGHVVVHDVDDPMIRDRDAMGVARQVVQYVRGTTERAMYGSDIPPFPLDPGVAQSVPNTLPGKLPTSVLDLPG